MQIQDLSAYTPQPGKALVLKSLKPNLTAHGGFQWPESGMIAAPDWSEYPVCGQGLHGWLWGAGDASLQVTGEDVKWLVLSVDADKVVELDGKVKFPDCEVIYCGSRETAVMIIAAYAPAGTKTMFVTMAVGSGSTVDAGDGSTVKAGYGSMVKAGYGSTVKAGSRSTVDAGSRSTVDAGYGSTVKAGSRSTVDAGSGSTVDAGYGSTVKAGYGSTVAVDSGSTVDAGDGSTVKAGDGSTVKAGDGSTVKAGSRSTVDAGDGSTVKAGDGSTVDAGDGSTVDAGDGSTVKAGGNAVLICHVIDRVFVLVIDGINFLPATTYKATYEGWVEATPEG